jgi:hypothetical protein
MKKTFILLTIACLAACVDLSAHEADGPETSAVETYEQHYDFRDFTALSVSNAFHVDFAFADDWLVDISVPDFIEPYLKVNRIGDKVRIGLNKLPVDIQRKLSKTSDALHATVRMPKLLSLSLSGAVRMVADGSQELDGETMFIDLSGASKLESLVSSGNGILHLELSGASKAGLQADFKQLDIGVSGASKLTLSGNADKVDIDCSGASGCILDGNFANADVDASGSSKVTMSGSTGNLNVESSGATKFESTGETARAVVELSGASKARLTVTEKLYYELSGASTLRVNNKGARITGEQSRGSKIEFER